MYNLLNEDKTVSRNVSHDLFMAEYEKQDKIKKLAEDFVGEFYISTVFLNIATDDNVFETMVFKKDRENIDFSGVYTQRYDNYIDAVMGHVNVKHKIQTDGEI
jgi:hypothetical protein